jgi:hypothetical protein
MLLIRYEHMASSIKPNRLRWATAAAGTVAALACVQPASAQSVDALLDKLVDKGVLTQQEATDLREEVDQNFKTAHAVRTGLPEWVTSLKLNGDMRGRFEGFYGDNDNFVDRNRLRYRLRFGATALFYDTFETGFRLSSSEGAGGFGGDPISGNTTFQDNASKKFVYVDLAYGKWTYLNKEGLSSAFIVGKMENPFTVSDMLFDGDYTPEGLAHQVTLTRHFGEATHHWRLNLGGFVLDEIGTTSSDPWLLGAQARWDAKWSVKLESSLGLGAYSLHNSQMLTNGAVPNVNAGNTRERAGLGELSYYMNPIVADASFTYILEKFPRYNGLFPIKVAGEFMHNPAAPIQNLGWWAGLTFGKAGKLGTWELGYRYKYLEGDAWYEEFVDSDFGAYYRFPPGALTGVPATGAFSGLSNGYRAGTGLKGHIVKASYSPFDSTTLSLTWFVTDLIKEVATPGTDPDSGMNRLQVDLVWKF